MESTTGVDHCLIYGNTGFTGGGIGVQTCSPVIESVTVNSNTGTNGGGIASHGGGSPTIRNSIITSSWVKDTTHSPCIDTGAPSSAWASEPSPNGARINMGRYGNTAQASKTYYTPIGSKQADMWLALPTGLWFGDGVYNTTGVDQTLTQGKDPGQKAVFRLRAQNDGPSLAYLKVKGDGSNNTFTVRYYDAAVGGTDITASITGTGWIPPLSNKGAGREFRVEIQVAPTALGNAKRTLNIAASDIFAPTVKDVVMAVTVCNQVRKPDGLIRKQGDADWAGDGVYNATGVGQTRSRTVAAGTSAIYDLKVQNDGNVSTQVRVKAPPGGNGWTIRDFSALTAGTEITNKVISTGWLSPVLAVGAQRELRVEVTPDSSVVQSTVREIAVTCLPRTVPLAVLESPGT